MQHNSMGSDMQQPYLAYRAVIVRCIHTPFMQFNPNSRTDGCTLLETSLANRSDEEESIDPKVVGVHTTNKQPQP